MKFSSASDYRSENTRLSESALLSLWAKLGDFQDDIVLVGGLVPRYICRPSADGCADGLEPNTLDVDFRIALAAGGNMYSLRTLKEASMTESGLNPECLIEIR
jgi:hypothetical protein